LYKALAFVTFYILEEISLNLYCWMNALRGNLRKREHLKYSFTKFSKVITFPPNLSFSVYISFFVNLQSTKIRTTEFYLYGYDRKMEVS